MDKIFSVYLLRCEENKRYAGSTLTDKILERFEKHMRGEGAKWTRQFPPIEIIQTWHGLTSREAFEMEHDTCEREMLLHKDLDACRGGRHNFPTTGSASHWWCPKHLAHLRR